MSTFNSYRTEEEYPSSDEKMDTGSDTIGSILSNSDSEDLERNPQVLRLTAPGPDTNSTQSSDSDELENLPQNQNTRIAENTEVAYKNPQVLRLSEPKPQEINDSLTTKMSALEISSPETISNQIESENQSKNFGISTPKICSTLTLTTSHPLMGLGSPEDYPDVKPKKVHIEDDKDLSLSSIEDDRHNESNGLYSPQRNTSKNNLYFTENFVTAESHILSDSLDLPLDVARVKAPRRMIIPKIEETPQKVLGRNFEGSKIDCAMKKSSQSTPKQNVDVTQDEFHSGLGATEREAHAVQMKEVLDSLKRQVEEKTEPSRMRQEVLSNERETKVAEWSYSTSQLRAMPNFDLPIEMSSSIGTHNDLESPDVISTSTQEEKSAYQALLDPYTGSVALRHTPRSPKANISPAFTRRKIQLPIEEDRCSLDSLSDATLESEEEPVNGCIHPCHQDCQYNAQICSDDDEDDKESKSTNTRSYSEPIPEYSAAEELNNERAWRTVPHHHTQVCDMKVIEPYKRVVSHGGYSGGLALVVFSACHLPDNSRQDYTYVMDNLFLYVIWTLERLVTEEYILVYLHGSAGRRRLPTLLWLHECYKLIDRRLRKSLKHLYLVHPTFWLKSFVLLTKPFISSKFSNKLSYVQTLDELMEKVPVEPNAIPDIVKLFDANRKR